MGPHYFLFVLMDCNGSLRDFKGSYASLLILMGLNESLLVLMSHFG